MKSEALSKKSFNRALKLNIIGGSAFTVWFSVCSPQPIFNVFFTNHLGATSTQLGILIGVVQLATIFNLVGIYAYGKLKTRKLYFIILHVLHRFFGILLAAVSFILAQNPQGNPNINLIIMGAGVSWILANSSSAGWWSWMADLIPDKIRATFFGKRSSIMNIVNIIWFLATTILLDNWTSVNIFFVYGVIFSFASIAGLMDILVFIFVPEPKQKNKPKISLAHFFEPLKNKNFVVYSIGVGVAVFAVNVFSPFTAPYITAKDAIGAPNIWLGVMMIISQLTWILASPSWGLIMDKFGRKPVLMIGCISAFANLFYLVLSPTNYIFVLPLIAVFSGLLAPALWDGINQLMLSLTPDVNRTAFVAWNMTIVGLVSAGGAFSGGRIKDLTQGVNIHVFGKISLTNIHIILLLSLILIVVSLLLLATVKEDTSKPLKYVVSRVVRPGVFRTFSNMGTLAGTTRSQKIEKTLRSIDNDLSDIALEDIIERLYDPDSEVRDEAARALGRIKSIDAVVPLMNEVSDPHSTIRRQAAIALGKIGDKRALPVLFKALDSNSLELKDAAIKALGDLGGDESIKNLLQIFKEGSERHIATGAIAASQIGILEASWDIIPMIHQSKNPVLAKQLAISIANLLGHPGGFYKYITGKKTGREGLIKNLFTDITKKSERFTVRYGGARFSPADRKRISALFKKIESDLFDDDYAKSFGNLKVVSKLLVENILGEKKPKEQWQYLEILFPINPKAGIWWWFITQSEEKINNVPREMVKINILIALYYLHIFRR